VHPLASVEKFMRTRVIHLINPKTDSLTTRPLYMKQRFILRLPVCSLLPHAFRATGMKWY
jgi:hypothetical protein